MALFASCSLTCDYSDFESFNPIAYAQMNVLLIVIDRDFP